MGETSKIPISLAVGVNVQDIFKHSFMYSRFSVSTGSTQPLRLYDSELLDSDIFEATRSGLASSTLDIFPDQPTTLVYKVQRKCRMFQNDCRMTAECSRMFQNVT